ncbi:MAG: 30S ribosomal protein S5 [SAR324 cluster bacterium]|nr:30S ribosomal protein S5 [SAR324 cluster bacterium]
MAEKVTEKNELIEKVIRVNRVAKVVKGGRRFSFSALVVVGDGKGKVGYGMGKAGEVTEAIRKGISRATKAMEPVSFTGTTIPHNVIGHSGAGKVYMRPAKKGHGVIAAGPVRSILEATGIHDISVKCLGSRNPHNLVRATFDALIQLQTFEKIAERRGKTTEYLNASN